MDLSIVKSVAHVPVRLGSGGSWPPMAPISILISAKSVQAWPVGWRVACGRIVVLAAPVRPLRYAR